jgi:hypothetical protein
MHEKYLLLVKVKSLCILIKHYTTKAYGGVDVLVDPHFLDHGTSWR